MVSLAHRLVRGATRGVARDVMSVRRGSQQAFVLAAVA